MTAKKIIAINSLLVIFTGILLIGIGYYALDNSELMYSFSPIPGFLIFFMFLPVLFLIQMRIKNNENITGLVKSFKIFSWIFILMLAGLIILDTYFDFVMFHFDSIKYFTTIEYVLGGKELFLNLSAILYSIKEFLAHLIFMIPYISILAVFVCMMSLNKKLLTK